jgi:hypothetical protein
MIYLLLLLNQQAALEQARDWERQFIQEIGGEYNESDVSCRGTTCYVTMGARSERLACAGLAGEGCTLANEE